MRREPAPVSRIGFVIAVWCFVLVASVLASAADAHEIRPCLLRITQSQDGRYEVLWKQPANGDVAIRLSPRLSSGALNAAPTVESETPTSVLRVWKNLSGRAQPLDGQTLHIEGLERTITDVLVSVVLGDGRSIEQILTPRRSSVRLDLSAHSAPAASGYLRLGVEHILMGTDHLLFVLGLLLLVSSFWSLLRTITAFTVAHSITLAASTLGWIHVRPAVVETLVALSIVILAVELVRKLQGEGGLTSRYPWLIAFGFGLLHGCAFAGALAEIGLPAQDVPLALFLFNVGVELGQLLFIAAALLAIHLLRRLGSAWQSPGVEHGPHSTRAGIAPLWAFAQAAPRWTRFAIPYAIGAFAASWFFERLTTVFTGASPT